MNLAKIPGGNGHMDDLDEILEALTTAWTAMAAKVATIWVPIQLAIIVLAALAGWGVATLIRKRVDFAKLMANWPIYPGLRRSRRSRTSASSRPSCCSSRFTPGCGQ